MKEGTQQKQIAREKGEEGDSNTSWLLLIIQARICENIKKKEQNSSKKETYTDLTTSSKHIFGEQVSLRA